MGINNLIQFLSLRFPEVFHVTPSIDHFAGCNVFIDCAILLQRSLHAAATGVLRRRRQEYIRASEAERQYIDARGIRVEICNHAAKPLLRLNQEIRAVKSKGGIKATFVLGSSLTVRDLYIASKVGGDGKGANVLDSRNPHLLNCLRAFFEGKPVARLYASPSEKDILLIAQRLMDAFARIEIRQPDIAQRCVEFCEDDDYVLSDDTNAIAFGAPNVIRDYCGRNVCNTLNHNRMLDIMGFSRQQFIDFCVLCGSDDTSLIPHIGPERAYHIISSFGDLQGFLESPALDAVLQSPNVAKILEKRQITVEQLREHVGDLEALRGAFDIRRART